MIRDICKDQAFLAQKAEPASPEDLPVAADLLETLEVHRDGCVGMAANMIGVNKRIIALDNQAERKIPGADQDLHRLDGPDYPARDRPLRGHYHLRGRGNL